MRGLIKMDTSIENISKAKNIRLIPADQEENSNSSNF